MSSTDSPVNPFPNFEERKNFAQKKEAKAIAQRVGGARPTARPVEVPNFNPKRDAIFNREMIASNGGIPRGAQAITAAGGFIPNFLPPFPTFLGKTEEKKKTRSAKGGKEFHKKTRQGEVTITDFGGKKKGVKSRDDDYIDFEEVE